MVQGKERSEWNRTSSQMAQIANLFRDPKSSRVVQPKDIHPHYSRSRRVTSEDREVTPEDLKKLKGRRRG